MTEPTRRVLVLDSDESAVAFVRSALEADKYEVVGETNGATGVVRARRERPHLIILDVYMIRHPGLYTLRDLKLDPRTKDIPVIMLSSVGRRLGVCFSTRDVCEHVGIEPDVLLEKPVDPTVLRGVAETLLGAARPKGEREMSGF